MRLTLSLLLITIIFLSNGYCEEGSPLPPIDPQMIIAGLKHTESLLRAGKCRIRYQGYSKLANVREEHESIFAFDLHRIYRYSITGIILNGKYLGNKGVRELYDIRTQTLFIIGVKVKGRIPVAVERGVNLPFPHSWDPRNYGMRVRDLPTGYPLSRLFEKNGVKIIGVEKMKRGKEEIPCYLVETKEKIWGKVRLWLDPQEGFLPIKMQMGDHWFMEMSYKPYKSNGQVVWFLEKGMWWSVGEKGDIIEKRIMEVKEFQPNVDISDLFQVDFPPDKPVWDGNLSKYRPFKEIERELKEIGLITE
ncbi:hypothetical protein J7M22_09150 [Candidatus Poribacteria bacterium]|nr:hypothetical protein [Candidatus Poribacteria bacterium]